MLLALAAPGLASRAALAGGQPIPPAAQALGARIEAAARQTVELDPADFARSEQIDHAWWPLKPGTQWIFEGYVEEDGKRVAHRQVFTVTDLTKVIGGVRCRVILDADYSKGKLIEKELTFFAQDKRGNVWHLGQYVETWEDDVFIGGHTWTVGNPRGAKAGIMMPADLRVGAPSYSEGFAPPPFSWTDRGRIYRTGQTISGPAGRYADVLVIEESDATHPGEFQLKYYARGVGNVRVGARGKHLGTRETLELVKLNQLDAPALAQVRATALSLEQRALMYATLPPAERAERAGPRVSEAQATAAALKAVPGEVTGVTIERKRGKNVYVVEIVAKDDGVETDVLVDLDSGKVLGTEK